jgi:GTPase SAR1 family protein
MKDKLHKRYLILNISQEATKFANQVGSFYVEVSAKLNLHVEKLFEEIANKLPKIQPERKGIDLDDPPKKPEQPVCLSRCRS